MSQTQSQPACAGADGSLMAFFGAFVREDMARLKAAQPSIDSRNAFASVLEHVRLLHWGCMRLLSVQALLF